MRETHLPEFKKRYSRGVPLAALLLIGAFVLYGWLGKGGWMLFYLPALAAAVIAICLRQGSVRCPHCSQITREQEHYDVGRPMVFICRRCDARLLTDVPVSPGD